MNKLISGILVILGIIGVLANIPAPAAKENLYSLTTKVIEVNYEKDIVICQDFNGTIWEFEGTEDWNCGDIAAFVMDDKGTPEIYDDEIISIRYNGWFKGWTQ